MNNYIIRQKDIELLMQSNKELYYKLELLNENMKVLDSIEGNLISDNISISADSDIRRVYNCELFVEDSTFDISYDSKIWYKRRIRPYIGILHQRSKEIQWYLLGTFLFTEAGYSYDDTNKTLSLTCNDMMCLLNGSMGGNLDSYKRTIHSGTSARSSIISLLEEVCITKYFIEFNLNGSIINDFQIPHDMTYNAGATAYQIIKDIVDLYSGTEIYFDVYGTFIINKIPTSKEEQAVLNDEILQPILISEQLSINFSEVYNDIEIFGRTQEPDFYSKDITYSNGVYYVSLVAHKLDETTNQYVEISYDSLDDFDEFSFKIPSVNITSNTYININNLGDILVVNENGNPIANNTLTKNTDYVFRYRKSTEDFLFLGQYQVYSRMYISNDANNTDANAVIDTDNEFAVEKIGHKLKVLSDDSVSNIYSDELCRQRCKYELYNATNKKNDLNLTTISIPWLDVNELIEFTSNSTGKKDKYIINSISTNYSEMTMNINANKFYAEYILN